MEAVVRHVNKSKFIQDAIVSSEDSALLHATYRLFLNYGFSMEYFIKAGFHYELDVQGVDSIFRENRKMNHLLKDFFEMTGGQFDYIIDQILQHSTQLKPKKDGSFTEHSTKKVFLKCMQILNAVLIHSMSDVLIDFCAEVCLRINSQSDVTEDRAGENIVCSFIIFRLLAPRLLDLNCCGTTPPNKVLTVVKLLNRVASSTNCMFNENNKAMDELIQEQNYKFTNTVARALLRHRKANYCHLLKLSHVRYSQSIEIFLKGLSRLQLVDVPTIPIKMKLSERRLNQKDSFEDLLKEALATHQNVNIKKDIAYFLLWSAEDVLNLIQMENLDLEFFEYWKLNGTNFMQLTSSSLKLMGMTDPDDIQAVINCIDDLSTMIICKESDLIYNPVSNWSLEEVLLWLIISNLSELVSVFRSHQINGEKLVQLTAKDLAKMKISSPQIIAKLMSIIKINA